MDLPIGFRSRVAKQAFGGRIPAHDESVQGLADDGVSLDSTIAASLPLMARDFALPDTSSNMSEAINRLKAITKPTSENAPISANTTAATANAKSTLRSRA